MALWHFRGFKMERMAEKERQVKKDDEYEDLLKKLNRIYLKLTRDRAHGEKPHSQVLEPYLSELFLNPFHGKIELPDANTYLDYFGFNRYFLISILTYIP